MDAADQAAREGKARRNRRPPGWKSRVQVQGDNSVRTLVCLLQAPDFLFDVPFFGFSRTCREVVLCFRCAY